MSDLMTRLRYYRCGDKACAGMAARAAIEIERLREALHKYGGHLDSCRPGEGCTCGLDAVLKP